MYTEGLGHPEFAPSQAELSRQAERRYILAEATRSLRQRNRSQRPTGLGRVRHWLAIRLVATARLIDTT